MFRLPSVMTWAKVPRSSEKEGSTKVSQFIFYKQQAVLPSQVSKTLRGRPLAATTNTELSPTHTWTLSSLTSPETCHTGRLIHYNLISFGHAPISDRGRHATCPVQNMLKYEWILRDIGEEGIWARCHSFVCMLSNFNELKLMDTLMPSELS